MRWTAVLSWHSTDSRLDATADMGRHGLPAGSAAILALGACLGACLAVAMVSAAPGRVALESSQQVVAGLAAASAPSRGRRDAPENSTVTDAAPQLEPPVPPAPPVLPDPTGEGQTDIREHPEDGKDGDPFDLPVHPTVPLDSKAAPQPSLPGPAIPTTGDSLADPPLLPEDSGDSFDIPMHPHMPLDDKADPQSTLPDLAVLTTGDNLGDLPLLPEDGGDPFDIPMHTPMSLDDDEKSVLSRLDEATLAPPPLPELADRVQQLSEAETPGIPGEKRLGEKASAPPQFAEGAVPVTQHAKAESPSLSDEERLDQKASTSRPLIPEGASAVDLQGDTNGKASGETEVAEVSGIPAEGHHDESASEGTPLLEAADRSHLQGKTSKASGETESAEPILPDEPSTAAEEGGGGQGPSQPEEGRIASPSEGGSDHFSRGGEDKSEDGERLEGHKESGQAVTASSQGSASGGGGSHEASSAGIAERAVLAKSTQSQLGVNDPGVAQTTYVYTPSVTASGSNAQWPMQQAQQGAVRAPVPARSLDSFAPAPAPRGPALPRMPPTAPTRDQIISHYLHDVFGFSDTKQLMERLQSSQPLPQQTHEGVRINFQVARPHGWSAVTQGGQGAGPYSADPYVVPAASAPTPNLHFPVPGKADARPLYFMELEGRKIPVYASIQDAVDASEREELLQAHQVQQRLLDDILGQQQGQSYQQQGQPYQQQGQSYQQQGQSYQQQGQFYQQQGQSYQQQGQPYQQQGQLYHQQGQLYQQPPAQAASPMLAPAPTDRLLAVPVPTVLQTGGGGLLQPIQSSTTIIRLPGGVADATGVGATRLELAQGTLGTQGATLGTAPSSTVSAHGAIPSVRGPTTVHGLSPWLLPPASAPGAELVVVPGGGTFKRLPLGPPTLVKPPAPNEPQPQDFWRKQEEASLKQPYTIAVSASVRP